MAAPGPTDRGTRVRLWAMLTSGTLAAATEAWLSALKLHPPRHAEWAGSIFWALISLFFSVSGGAIVTWVAGFVVSATRQAALTIVRSSAAGWAFLPALSVLALHRSWLLFPLAALITVASAFRLRPLFRDAAVRESEYTALPTLYGLPATGIPPLRSFIVAFTVQACIVLAIANAFTASALAFASSLAMLIAWWTPADSIATRLWSGDRRTGQLATLSLLILLVFLAPWIASTGGPQIGGRGGAPELPALHTNRSGGEFVGVILWPPPKKKIQVSPPRPNTSSPGRGIGSPTLIIPFDGPYWYFKAPMIAPDERAHVTFGKPTEASVRSTDHMPLRMEAHMNLGLPIQLNCCREIDVTVTNADDRTGRIDVALALIDSNTPGRHSLFLGDQPLNSSVTGKVTRRTPVTETLHFTVPLTPAIRQFNEINVILQPSAELSHVGARIAVEQFELVPR